MQDAQNTLDSVQDLGAEHNRGTLAGAISRRDALAWLSVAPAALLVKDALAQPRRPEGMVRAEGDVRVNGAPAKRGQVIKPGDVVATGRNAFAIFTVGEDAFLMRSVSRVETAGSGGFADVLRLVTGKMLSVFSKGERRLESPTATIGIRGTGVYLEVERTRTYACTCYGSVVLAPAGMPQMTENIKTEHHEPHHHDNDTTKRRPRTKGQRLRRRQRSRHREGRGPDHQTDTTTITNTITNHITTTNITSLTTTTTTR